MSEPLSKLVIPSPVGPMQAFASDLGLRAVLFADSDPSRNGVSGPVKTGEEIQVNLMVPNAEPVIPCAGDIGGDSMTFGDATAFPKVTFRDGGGGGAAPDGRRTRSLGRGGVAGGFS